jgi:hypothetical protein
MTEIRRLTAMVCSACKKPMSKNSRFVCGGKIYDFHNVCPKKKTKLRGWNTNSGLFKKPLYPEIVAYHRMSIGGYNPH